MVVSWLSFLVVCPWSRPNCWGPEWARVAALAGCNWKYLQTLPSTCNVLGGWGCAAVPSALGEEAGSLASSVESASASGARRPDHWAGSWKFAFQVDCISISEESPLPVKCIKDSLWLVSHPDKLILKCLRFPRNPLRHFDILIVTANVGCEGINWHGWNLQFPRAV